MSRLFASTCLVLLSGCSPLTFLTELKGESVVMGSPMQQPPPVLNAFPSIGGLNDLDFNNLPEFQNASVTRNHVGAVAVDSVTIKILTPSDQNFTFLDMVQLVARAGDKEVVFAEKDVKDVLLPAPSPVLTLDLKVADLAPWVTAPIMSIVMRGKGRQPANDTRLEVKVKLRVSASP